MKIKYIKDAPNGPAGMTDDELQLRVPVEHAASDDAKHVQSGFGTKTEHRAIEARVMELLGRMMAGSSPGPEVSGLKIRGTELSQDILELALEAAGPHALPYDFAACGAPLRPWAGAPDGAQGAASAYLYRRAWTILGGSTEVQKNILSKAVLGL